MKSHLSKKKNKDSFIAILERFDSNLWYFHILVPKEIAENLITGKNRRIVCTLNDTESFQCALMHKGGGEFFINVNQKIRTKLRLKLHSEVEVCLQKDKSEYGLPMPEELMELLQIDDEGNTLFHALTRGKQRTLLHMIGTPKSSDIRIRKAICIIDHLKFNNGKINYKLLNEALKNSK